jgi:hypothetical protein
MNTCDEGPGTECLECTKAKRCFKYHGTLNELTSYEPIDDEYLGRIYDEEEERALDAYIHTYATPPNGCRTTDDYEDQEL